MKKKKMKNEKKKKKKKRKKMKKKRKEKKREENQKEKVSNVCLKIIGQHIIKSTYSVQLYELSGKDKKRRMVARLSDMDQEQLLPFVLERMQDEGSQEHVQWLQDQLLEAAYVRLGQCFNSPSFSCRYTSDRLTNYNLFLK